MYIANPIYDVVFKYLMEDRHVAILMLSTILDEEIVDLDFLPQENTVMLDQRSLTVYRLDFSAKIKKPDNSYKHVIIEIQKAKFATDIMRFRRYLGDQYQKKENAYTLTVKGKECKHAMPIVSIYFLGYRLEHTTVPVIKVARHYYDVATGEKIQEREEFIESLSHDAYVIQIPHLKPDHRTELEQLLTIFDQHHITSDKHILNITEEEVPEQYHDVFRRLQRAIADPAVKRTMDVEDDILEEIQDMERELGDLEQEIEEKNQLLDKQDKALNEQDKALNEKDEALNEKDRALNEKDKTLNEKDKALDEKNKALGEKDKALGEKDKALGEKDKALDEMDKTLSEKDKLIEELQKRLTQSE